jgi:predicted amidohydrolase YtcJ
LSLLLINAEVSPGVRKDVRVDGDRIAAIGHRLCGRTCRVIDAGGGALLPALYDHHVHLRSIAARADSLDVGPGVVRGKARLVGRLRKAAVDPAHKSCVRAVGYHESVAGPLDRDVLDEAVAGHPVRVQHRSGELWILNSAALRDTGLETLGLPGVERDQHGRATGRLWRLDGVARERFDSVDGDLGAVSREAAAMGIAGFTDATVDRDSADASDLAALRGRGVIAQRLCLMAREDVDPEAGRPGATLGPVKMVLDDLRLPSLDRLAQRIVSAHQAGRCAAIHCVTDVQLALTVAALRLAGPRRGDRIEHGAVIHEDIVPTLRSLEVTIVTQPNFISERGDSYRRAVPAADHEALYRCNTLIRAGVAVAFGTDAPFGGLDPWAAMRAAVERRTSTGTVLAPRERISANEALRRFQGTAAAPASPRVVVVGAPADLCLLHVPLDVALGELDASFVRGTLIEGKLAYLA